MIIKATRVVIVKIGINIFNVPKKSSFLSIFLFFVIHIISSSLGSFIFIHKSDTHLYIFFPLVRLCQNTSISHHIKMIEVNIKFINLNFKFTYIIICDLLVFIYTYIHSFFPFITFHLIYITFCNFFCGLFTLGCVYHVCSIIQCAHWILIQLSVLF